MPDLSHEASRAWFERAAPGLAHLDALKVRPVEEDPKVDAALVALGAALETARARGDRSETGIDPQLLSRILPQLGLCRTLHILAWFAETREGGTFVTRMIDAEGEGAPLPALLVQLNRHATAARIFAPDRVDLLLESWSRR